MIRFRKNWKASPCEKAMSTASTLRQTSSSNAGIKVLLPWWEGLGEEGDRNSFSLPSNLPHQGRGIRCGLPHSFTGNLPRLFLLFMLLFGCAPAPEPMKVANVAQKGPSSVAVWDFDNLSPTRFAQPDLGERLAAEATEAIMRKGTWEVVERQRLLLVLEEQHLGSQDFVDESTRLRLGKMAGARTMVFGAYQSFGGDQTRIDVRLVDVETGQTLKSVDKMAPSGNFQAWYQIVRQAAEELM